MYIAMPPTLRCGASRPLKSIGAKNPRLTGWSCPLCIRCFEHLALNGARLRGGGQGLCTIRSPVVHALCKFVVGKPVLELECAAYAAALRWHEHWIHSSPTENPLGYHLVHLEFELGYLWLHSVRTGWLGISIDIQNGLDSISILAAQNPHER